MGRPFNLERFVRVTFDVCYLCANFSLPATILPGIGLNVRDRGTDVRHEWVLNAPNPNGAHNNECSKRSYDRYHRCVAPCGETTFSPQDHPVCTN